MIIEFLRRTSFVGYFAIATSGRKYDIGEQNFLPGICTSDALRSHGMSQNICRPLKEFFSVNAAMLDMEFSGSLKRKGTRSVSREIS